jgi:hypothetical protein
VEQRTCRVGSGAPPRIRLYLAGLNHARGPGTVQAPGVSELVDFIAKHPGSPDNVIVAISGSDPRPGHPGGTPLCIGASGLYTGDVPPLGIERSGECIQHLLEHELGGTWTTKTFYVAEWGGGGFAVVVGPRFRVLGSTNMVTGTTKYLSVEIQDTSRPVDKFFLNLMHTSGNDAAVGELRPQVEYFRRNKNKTTHVTPLFVGDFNVPDKPIDACTTDSNVVSFKNFVEGNLRWLSRKLTCEGGSPAFDIDDKLHVLAGSATGPLAFDCARGELETVSISYTVQGGNVDTCQGAVFPHIGHNVIALGLDIKRRTPAARCTACPTGTTMCSGQCKDLQDDPRNCGKCGRRCTSGQECLRGRCRRT